MQFADLHDSVKQTIRQAVNCPNGDSALLDIMTENKRTSIIDAIYGQIEPGSPTNFDGLYLRYAEQLQRTDPNRYSDLVSELRAGHSDLRLLNAQRDTEFVAASLEYTDEILPSTETIKSAVALHKADQSSSKPSRVFIPEPEPEPEIDIGIDETTPLITPTSGTGGSSSGAGGAGGSTPVMSTTSTNTTPTSTTSTTPLLAGGARSDSGGSPGKLSVRLDNNGTLVATNDTVARTNSDMHEFEKLGLAAYQHHHEQITSSSILNPTQEFGGGRQPVWIKHTDATHNDLPEDMTPHHDALGESAYGTFKVDVNGMATTLGRHNQHDAYAQFLHHVFVINPGVTEGKLLLADQMVVVYRMRHFRTQVESGRVPLFRNMSDIQRMLGSKPLFSTADVNRHRVDGHETYAMDLLNFDRICEMLGSRTRSRLHPSNNQFYNSITAAFACQCWKKVGCKFVSGGLAAILGLVFLIVREGEDTGAIRASATASWEIARGLNETARALCMRTLALPCSATPRDCCSTSNCPHGTPQAMCEQVCNSKYDSCSRELTSNQLHVTTLLDNIDRESSVFGGGSWDDTNDKYFPMSYGTNTHAFTKNDSFGGWTECRKWFSNPGIDYTSNQAIQNMGDVSNMSTLLNDGSNNSVVPMSTSTAICNACTEIIPTDRVTGCTGGLPDQCTNTATCEADPCTGGAGAGCTGSNCTPVTELECTDAHCVADGSECKDNCATYNTNEEQCDSAADCVFRAGSCHRL